MTFVLSHNYIQLIPGITGDVNIDENGDRIADYSLLDMDPETSRFEVRYPRDLIFYVLYVFNI